MLIALPNLDGSFTVTLFLAFEGKHAFENLNTEQEVLDFFNEVFPDVVPHMPTLVEDFFGNPTSSLCNGKMFPVAIQRQGVDLWRCFSCHCSILRTRNGFWI